MSRMRRNGPYMFVALHQPEHGAVGHDGEDCAEQLHDVGQLARWPQMGLGRVGMKNSPESMTEGGTGAGSSDCIPVGVASVPHARSLVSFDMPAAHGLPARILVHTRPVPP